jgi:hypothetical protein
MKLLLLSFALSISTFLYAQEPLPLSTITVTAQAATKELAVTEALRAALEQAYGAYITSSTVILNDQVVRDEITSISNGSIQKYEILNQEQFKSGTYAVTIKAVVSIANLVSFIKSKGYEIEVSGGLFAMNIKQKQLNETAEKTAVYNLVAIVHDNMHSAFNYEITSGEPEAINNDNNKWQVPLIVTAIANENMESCQKYLYNALSAISLTKEEADDYIKLGKTVYTFPLLNIKDSSINVFLLRNESSQKMLELIFDQSEFYIRRFTIDNGIKKYNGHGDAVIYDNLIKGKDYYYYYQLQKGDTAALINYNDQLTLAEFEKLNKYKVLPNIVKVQIKNGGMVFYEDNEKVYVVNLFDIGDYSLEDAKKACKELNLFGYNDWRLPSRDDLILMANNLEMFKLGGFLQRDTEIKSTNPQIRSSALDYYWNTYDPRKNTATSSQGGVAWNPSAYWFDPSAIRKVRAVRRYSVNGGKLKFIEDEEQVTLKTQESTLEVSNQDEYIGVYEFEKKEDFKIIVTQSDNKYLFTYKQNKKNKTTSDIVDEQMAVISLGYEYYTRTWPTQKMKEVGKDTFQIIDSEESIFAKKAKLVFNRNQDGEISSISFTSKNDETFTSIRSVKLKK